MGTLLRMNGCFFVTIIAGSFAPMEPPRGGGVWGHPPPSKFFKMKLSEMLSGAYFRP